ncbi:hypothetical protein [Kordiimonas lacus]|uniref:Nucleotide-diphospho-sugar transferase n=1 Tax=Kordiimonas lacus TaxID=637679 RepID=A0A1G7B9A8_9PROT|nr:hypothetical protein [Kordiimonas lacus]SDE23708.1 hypothetical protein SAMN04488071_2423 [Kordiimonas lacus]
MKTVILQSHTENALTPWLRGCLSSVEAWAARVGADYCFLGDELFSHIPRWVQEKVSPQTVIATDLARLRLMQHALRDGYDRVVWLDADMLIFAPERFQLPDGTHAVGREAWVQQTHGSLKAYKKVHNAFLMTTTDDTFLPFYADAAERMLTRAQPPLVPQFIGPKLLTALHNMTELCVEERAGMLSPLALRAVLNGGGKAYEMTLEGHKVPPAAFNLSASYCGRASDGVCNTDADYAAVIEKLMAS